MSIKINVTTGQKKSVAQILKAVAEWIETSANKQIILNLSLEFVKD